MLFFNLLFRYYHLSYLLIRHIIIMITVAICINLFICVLCLIILCIFILVYCVSLAFSCLLMLGLNILMNLCLQLS
jgi:hypothetical protein